jgi:hypothetical protein
MGNSHEESLTELDHRLDAALAGKDDDGVKEVLAEIGKAELANGRKKCVRPTPANNGNSPL